MNINFDYYNRAKSPTLLLCNPNNKVIAPIPIYDNLVIKPTFNGLSELSLNIYKYVKNKTTIQQSDAERSCECYKHIDIYRQIHIEDLGYFIITDCEEYTDDVNPYFTITANSCEIELDNSSLDIADGTYKFYDSSSPSATILGKILNLCPNWNLGNVSDNVRNRYRTFTDLKQNVYSFMISDMENTYECVVDFDIQNRIINVIDAYSEIPSTDILLTFDNVLQQAQIVKSSNNIVTAVDVHGANDLEIRNANPMGTNVIYQFDYYKNTQWMTSGLIDAITVWENKIKSKESQYDTLISQLTLKQNEYAVLDAQLADLTTELKSLKQIESVSTNSDYANAHHNVLLKQTEVDSKQTQKDNKKNEITTINTQLTTLQSSLSILNNFTKSQYKELSLYIHQVAYQDENITTTDSMTYEQKQNQVKELYNRSKKLLDERAQPTLTITFDCNNFLFIKEFDRFRTQFNLGKKIHVEVEKDNIIDVAVLQYELNFDDKSLKITVSNRLKLKNDYTSLGDLQQQVSASASSISFGKDTWSYPVKSGLLDELDEFTKKALNLSNNPLVFADGQRAAFDDTGYHGFRYHNGTYDPEQIQITNNIIRFTDDNWNTIKSAFGKFQLSNGTWVYGLSADAVVAGTIDAKTVNVINLVADNIKTGILESQNGKYSLDMATGEVNMKSGTFSGKIESSSIEWTYGGDLFGYIDCKDDTDGLLISADYITLDGRYGINAKHLVVQALSVDQEINVLDRYGNSDYGKNGTISWEDKDGHEYGITFVNGIITSYNK